MYVGRNYESTVATSQADVFHCVHCSYECPAMVTGLGTGHGRSPFMLDNSGAEARAHDSALGNARANMHFALAGAKCPSCGKHDASARRHVYLGSIVRGLGLGLVIGAFIVAALKGSRFGWGAAIAGLVVTTAIMTAARSQRMLSGAILQPAGTPSTTSRLGLR